MKRLFYPLLLISLVVLTWVGLLASEPKGRRIVSTSFFPFIPQTWDSIAFLDYDLPLANPKASPKHIPPSYYYQLPERVIFKSYPVYAPGREPKGYWEWLHEQEPEVAFDPAKLKTEEDWIKAGELVFDAPIDTVGRTLSLLEVRDSAHFAAINMPVSSEGIIPEARYVITRKGKVLLGSNGCNRCHTRVMPDGSVIKGAQSRFPDGRRQGLWVREMLTEAVAQRMVRNVTTVPWIKDDPHAKLSMASKETIAQALEAMPTGTTMRAGTGILFPAAVPDLIGVKDRKYLDHTGHNRHRDIGDLMRYAAMNQVLHLLSSYDGFIPAASDGKTLPPPGKSMAPNTSERYSDAQLYALAKYIHSLKPPANPHKPSALSRKGEIVFAKQGCVTCHTPPFFTNNKLTPVDGFTVPEEHLEQYDIFNISVGTDPDYALKTRRGTGYYKVPSLKGVWYRGPFFHDGSLATLEDVLEPKRLKEDYVPTGFKGAGVTHRPVRGHEFGLDLREGDRKALLAYLRTL